VGFGPGGPGAIYKIDLTSETGTSAPQIFYTFPAAEVGGTNIHDALQANPSQTSTDNSAFDKVGKTSLGGLEVSDDDRELYVINLFNKKLYKFDLTAGTGTTPVSYDIPAPVVTPTPPGGLTWRPFALKYYRGKVYVGITVTNENSYSNTTTYTSTSPNDKGNNQGMQGIVYAFDGSNWEQVLSFPLNYKKQPTSSDLANASNVQRGHTWRPWTSVYRYDRASSGAGNTSYAQPWLTDIEFDVNGEMIIGIRDRWGDQMGYQNIRPSSPVGPGATTSTSAINPGEVLRAGKVSLTENKWAIEYRGTVTHLGNTTTASLDQKKQFGPGGEGKTYTPSTTEAQIISATYFNNIATNTNNPPGVEGKYYWGDLVGAGYNHGSSSSGGLALLAGSNKLIMTAMDPTDEFNTSGIKRLHNGDGFVNNRNTAASAGSSDDSQDNTGGSTMTGSGAGTRKGAILARTGSINWGKANGMGEIELLTEPAPVEIGNRVWQDNDGDGIQDADEPALAGVIVELWNADGTVKIATAVTDENGNYLFSSDPNRTSSDAFIYNLTDLEPGGQYKIRIPNASKGPDQQEALKFTKLTEADQSTGLGDGEDDSRDSDGIIPTGQTYAEIEITTGQRGENNHTYDFGFVPMGALGDYVWYDNNSNGTLDPVESGVNGVTVTLYRLDEEEEVFVPYGEPQQTRVNPETGLDGWYWFDDLPGGTYKVLFSDVPEGYDFTKDNEGSDDKDSDANHEGWSQEVQIITTEPVESLARVNPTIDAGIEPVGSIGNYVWFDSTPNGKQDDTKEGINGVFVELYVWEGDEETGAYVLYETAVTTNDPNDPNKKGWYTFDKLRSGKYKVKFIAPEGYEFTYYKNGDNGEIDSDASKDEGQLGWSDEILIDTSLPMNDLGRNNPTIDAGLVFEGALPVKLIHFDGAREANTVLLKWATSSEINASYFEVIRSANGQNWMSIGKVSAIGNSQSVQQYAFTDANPSNGINYYRLRSVDVDGSSELGQVISIKMGIVSASYVYPNPASEVIRFGGELRTEEVNEVSVSNMAGNVVYRSRKLTSNGISAAQLQPGMYVIRLKFRDGSTVSARPNTYFLSN